MGELVGSDSPITDLPRDTTLVVAGPPMTGKYTLMLTILAYHTDNAILISTKNAAPRVVDDFNAIRGESYGRVGVVDCVSRPDGLEQQDTELMKYVGSPENLTRIGVKFTDLFDRFYTDEAETSTGVGIHSISQLLMHSGLKNVYQFLQVLTGQIRSADWLCVAVIDTNMDEEELQTLYHHFDGIVQTRENAEGHREFRVRGLTPTTSQWTTF